MLLVEHPASGTGSAPMWSITPGMGIIMVSQWQDREQLQEFQVSDVKTTNRGKLLKNNSNHFNNKMYLETLQMGESYNINTLHIQIRIKRR